MNTIEKFKDETKGIHGVFQVSALLAAAAVGIIFFVYAAIDQWGDMGLLIIITAPITLAVIGVAVAIFGFLFIFFITLMHGCMSAVTTIIFALLSIVLTAIFAVASVMLAMELFVGSDAIVQVLEYQYGIYDAPFLTLVLQTVFFIAPTEFFPYFPLVFTITLAALLVSALAAAIVGCISNIAANNAAKTKTRATYKKIDEIKKAFDDAMKVGDLNMRLPALQACLKSIGEIGEIGHPKELAEKVAAEIKRIKGVFAYEEAMKESDLGKRLLLLRQAEKSFTSDAISTEIKRIEDLEAKRIRQEFEELLARAHGGDLQAMKQISKHYKDKGEQGSYEGWLEKRVKAGDKTAIAEIREMISRLEQELSKINYEQEWAQKRVLDFTAGEAGRRVPIDEIEWSRSEAKRLAQENNALLNKRWDLEKKITRLKEIIAQ